MTNIRPTLLIAVLFFLGAAVVMRAEDRALEKTVTAGIFVTPVAGAPFSAEVERDTMQALKDGSRLQRRTVNTIARDSQGRIRNERHEVLASTSTRKPILYSVHLYDPDTRVSTILNPLSHIATQRTLERPPSTEPPSEVWLRKDGPRITNPHMKVQDLGLSVIEGLDVHGFRTILTVPAEDSGTSRPVVVTSEYWYSEELRIDLLTKHSDPRSGDLTITVKQINPNEPNPELFAIPPDYKLLDVTPEQTESSNPVVVEP